MFMVFFVLDNVDLLTEVLENWAKAGIQGTTIIESTGIHRRLAHRLPMRFLFQSDQAIEEGNCVLMSIVDSEELVKKCLEATESLVGDLNLPNTGVFAAWPVMFVKGVPEFSQKVE
jgi:hypothetical protein